MVRDKPKPVEISVDEYTQVVNMAKVIDEQQAKLYVEERALAKVWQCVKCKKYFSGETEYSSRRDSICEACGIKEISHIKIYVPTLEAIKHVERCHEQGNDCWPTFKIESHISKSGPVEVDTTHSDSLHLRDAEGNNIITIDTTDANHFNIFSDYHIERDVSRGFLREDVFILRKQREE